MAIKFESVPYCNVADGLVPARARHSPHYEFGALYALFFGGSNLVHASSSVGDCLVSVSEHGTSRSAIAFAPAGSDLPVFFRELPVALALTHTQLTSIKHVPARFAHQISSSLADANQVICGPETAVEFEDRFPQIEWNLREVLSEAPEQAELLDGFSGPEFSNWRYQARRFIRTYGEPRLHDFIAVKDRCRLDAFAARVAREMDADHGGSRGKRATSSVSRFISRLAATSAEHFGRVIEVGDEVIGLWIAGPVTERVAALYVHLADRRCRGAAQLCFLDAIRMAKVRGFDRLCVGGSESGDLMRFKAWNFGQAFVQHGALRQLCEIDFRAVGTIEGADGRFHEAFAARHDRLHDRGHASRTHLRIG